MNQHSPLIIKLIRPLPLVLVFAFATATSAQTLTEEFITAGYAITDLGSVTDLPANYGGLTIRPEEPNTLYIGGSANQATAAVYTVPLVRDPNTQGITAFGGAAIHHVDAPNIDGGLTFAPNGTMLFTRYSNNELGQILTDSTYVSTPLVDLGVISSVGSLALVPSGYQGAGNLIFSSYNGHTLYHLPYTIDVNGQYVVGSQIAETSVLGTASGPEGIAYVPTGSAGFPNPSMVISAYGMGTIVVFDVDEAGLPITSTARTMVTGLSGAEGALIDPVTGDFLFSTFGGGSRVIRISGFAIPSAIAGHQDGRFGMYPNPTSGQFQIMTQGDMAHLQIFNALGERLLSRRMPGRGPHSFDLSAYPQGVYFVEVLQGDRKWAERLVKE
jgi:hypothetical protein